SIPRGLRGRLAAALGDGETPHVARSRSLPSLREELLSVAMPAEVQRHLLDARVRMGEGSVAVRSSGTREDMPYVSFAGQYETVARYRRRRPIDDRCEALLGQPM